MRKSRVLDKLRKNDWAISVGTSFTTSSRVTELAAMIGFDCLWIDMEHRSFNYEDVFRMIQGARAADADCMVRIRKESDADYFRPLEDGAAGIIVPHCRCAKEAEYAAYNCKYRPMGMRGIDGVGADSDYGLAKGIDYMDNANSETFLAVQIEDREAVECIDEIAAVPGVDILFIGPGDLTKSYGITGDTKNRIFADAVSRVASVAEKYKKWWGIPALDTETANRYLDMGAKFIHTGSDMGVLSSGLQNIYNKFSDIRLDRS